MPDIESSAPVAIGATETSPLLADPTKGLPKANGQGNGTTNGHANGNGHTPSAGENGGDDDGDYKIPEMREKMHLLIPAVGVGVSSLCTIIQRPARAGV